MKRDDGNKRKIIENEKTAAKDMRKQVWNIWGKMLKERKVLTQELRKEESREQNGCCGVFKGKDCCFEATRIGTEEERTRKRDGDGETRYQYPGADPGFDEGGFG